MSVTRPRGLPVFIGSIALFGAATAGSAWAQQAEVPKPAPSAQQQPVAAQAPAAAPAQRDWVDEVKNPVSWFKWGADLRLREEYYNNANTLNDELPGHEQDYQRYRARTWATVSPIDNLDLNGRLVWEGRHWTNPRTPDEWDWSDVIIDTFNAKARNIANLPLTATVGRQDILLGDGWLLFEGTPLDGSRTVYFDAARFTVDFKESKNSLDLIYINQFADPDDWLPLIGGDQWNARKPAQLLEQNERGAVVYLTNKAIENTTIEPYFIYKQNDPRLATGDTGEIYTLGTRATRTFDEHWKGRIEGAYQFGQRENILLPDGGQGNLQAWGINSRLAYAFNDELKNQIFVGDEYLSGDDPDTLTNEQFVPLWGRWPQWSEIWAVQDGFEFRPGETTNLNRPFVGWQMNPTKKLELSAVYNLLFSDQNTFTELRPADFDDGSFRGQLMTAVLRYRFNRFMTGLLQGEYFIPGDYYSDNRQDNAVFFRAELSFAF